jgi:HEPN domain-containing protein
MNRAEDWLKQAEVDLDAAEVSAAHAYHEWAAFQAQQSAEKAVKALVQHVHAAVRGHSIKAILDQLPAPLQAPAALSDAAREPDKVYVTARYPNGFVSGTPSDYFTAKNSEQLIGYARSILEFCRSQMH